MLLLLSSRHGEPSEARCAPWRCLCRCTCCGTNECAFHRNITKWVSLALRRGRRFRHSSMEGWNPSRDGCLVGATRCGRPSEGGHAGPTPTEHIFAGLYAGYPCRHDERCYLNLLVSHWQSLDSKWKNLPKGA